MYGTGKGVPQDDKEGVRWYRKTLAGQGDADAQSSLGNMYAGGKGVPKDYKEAVKWFRLAAEQGLANAQHYLAWMYLSQSMLLFKIYSQLNPEQTEEIKALQAKMEETRQRMAGYFDN